MIAHHTICSNLTLYATLPNTTNPLTNPYILTLLYLSRFPLTRTINNYTIILLTLLFFYSSSPPTPTEIRTQPTSLEKRHATADTISVSLYGLSPPYLSFYPLVRLPLSPNHL